MKNKWNKQTMIFGLLLTVALSIGTPAYASKQVSPNILKALKEAENLSLNHERLLASNVLIRNLKKANNKADLTAVREKLNSLSRVFYTDKGFDAFLRGKELFEKQKFADSLDQLLEADEEERGNVDVLHLMTLGYLQTQKVSFAEATSKRALQIGPNDLDLERDKLAVLVAQEKWDEALQSSDHLITEFSDASAQTLSSRGLAQMKLGFTEEARRSFDSVLQKDPKSVETYYWLASLKPAQEATPLLSKYVEICKNKQRPQVEREPNLCGNLADAEKRLKL